ncbi:hypothetical protein VP249E411_P0133 [Vibrio phage 249E41-1]|nr:hypothetical protein VP249E411_P0133 [Vibrio phage 249E41-1]CAH9017106.1 hypothetical protein VP193E371_P0131 [Vibrio phage 193E37-1]
MTSHELAKLLLENNDAPISGTVEIETGVYDKHGEEIIAHLDCFSIIDVYARQFEPNGEVFENKIHFECSVSRTDGIDVVQVVSDAAKKMEK